MTEEQISESVRRLAVMDELEKDYLYVLGQLTGLVEKGLVTTTAPCAALTPEGMELFHVLKILEWRPTPARIAFVAEMLRADESTE